MDEYIKREDALDAVLFALSGTGLQSRAITAIKDVPTATSNLDIYVVMKILNVVEKSIQLKMPHKTYTTIGGRAMGNSFEFGREQAYYEVLQCINEIRIKLLEDDTDENIHKTDNR